LEGTTYSSVAGELIALPLNKTRAKYMQGTFPFCIEVEEQRAVLK
jgi:hypothetical protein